MTLRKVSLIGFLASLVLAGCGESAGSPMPALESSGGTGSNVGGVPNEMLGDGGTPTKNNETGGQPAGSGGAPGTGGNGGTVGSGGTPNAMGGSSRGGAPNATGGSGPGGGSGGYAEDVGVEGDGNFVIPAPHLVHPDLTDQGNPKGKLIEFTIDVSDSTIFQGATTRRVGVYVPAAYVDGTEAPILVVHDYGSNRMTEISNALDNLTISKDPSRKLPPFIAIALSHGPDRGFEYDTMTDELPRFIHGDVLPKILSNADLKAAYPKIAFTKNPWGRASMGCSSAGAAAVNMAWFAPDLFRRVISYSGTLVHARDSAMYPLGGWEYHSSMELIKNAETKPLRIFLQVSENDNGFDEPEGTHRNWVLANQRTAAALAEKKYHYRWVLTADTSHCGSKTYDSTLADALVWVWRGYHD